MPPRHLLSIGFLVACLLPWSASAATITEWDFSDGVFHEGWEAGGNPSFERRPDGLLITTLAQTLFGRSIQLTHPIEVIAIDYMGYDPIEGWVYWHRPGDPQDDLLRAPLLFSPTEGIGTVSVDMTKFHKWKRNADFVGIGLPEGSQILLQRIRLMSWSPGEKLIEGLKSFWTFDVRRPSSVNFLWGPHIVWNPLAREVMFRVSAPAAESVNRYFYFVMVLGIAWTLFKIRKHPVSKKKTLTALLTLMAVLWVFYDVRMGSEFFGYLQRDYRKYWSRPVGERTFRERSYFNDFAAAIAPMVQDREEYIFVATHRWPFLGLIRYYTYPSIPTQPFQEGTHIDTWVVYDRPDIIVNKQGELESEGTVLSSPGAVLHEFSEGTFIFREQS